MRKYLSLVVIAMAALFYSCEELLPTLKLTSNSSMSFEASGGSGTIYYSLTGAASGSVTAIADSWIQDINYGVTGRVTFNVPANESTSERTGKITVTYTTQSFEVTITQAGKPADQPGEGGGDQPGEGGGDEPGEGGGDEPGEGGGDEPGEGGGDEPGEGGGDEPDQPGDEPEEPFTPDMSWVATKIHGSYMGDANGYYKSNSYSIYLSDNGIQSGTMPEKPNSTYMHVSFYSDVEFDEETKLIPYGTYTYDATVEDVDGNISKYSQGYYKTNDKGYVDGDNYKFASGTMTVSPQGIVIEMTDNTGVKRAISYSGKPLLNAAPEEEPEESDDVNIEDAYLTGYFMLLSDGKTYDYTLYFSEVEIDLLNEEIPSETPNSPIMMVDICSTAVPVDGKRLPNGTYEGVEEFGEDGTIALEDSCIIYTDENGVPDEDEYTLFTEAKLVVNGTTLTFEAEDAEGNKYTAAFSGNYELIDDGTDMPNPDDIEVITFGETVAQGVYLFDPSDAEAPYPIWMFEATPTSGDGYGLYLGLYPEQDGFDQNNLEGTYESVHVDSYIPAYQGWLTTWADAEEVDEVDLMGDITVSVNGENLVIRYSDDDMQFTWEGEVAWTNQSPEQGGDDEETVHEGALLSGWYEGVLEDDNNNEYHYYDIWLSNRVVTIENNQLQLYTNSWYYETVLLLDQAPVDGKIPNGTYEMTGNLGWDVVYDGRIIETNASAVSYQANYASATMVVTDNGITLNVVDANGLSHKVTFAGDYTLQGEYGEEEPEDGVWSWDVSETNGYAYYNGDSKWYIELWPLSVGQGFVIDLVAGADGLSADLSGTYTPADNMSTPNTYQKGADTSEGLSGSALIQVQESSVVAVPMVDGNVIISKNADDTYNISYSGYNSDQGYQFEFDWTGTLYLRDNTPKDFDKTASYISGMYRGKSGNNFVYGIRLSDTKGAFGKNYANSFSYSLSFSFPEAFEKDNCFDIPAGTYPVDVSGAYSAGTVTVEYREADDTQIIRNVIMTEGSVTIDANGITTLDMVDEAGNSHKVTYSGSTHIDDVKSTMEGDYIVDEPVSGTMMISDWGDLDANGVVPNAKSAKYVQLSYGNMVGVVVLLSDEATATNELAVGTYNVETVRLDGTPIDGKTVMAGRISGSINYSFIGEETDDGFISGYHLLNSGTVTVSKSGSEYTIEVDGYNEDPHNPKKIQYTWKGTAPAAAQVSAPAQNVAKIAPAAKVVTKTSAKVNADMKRAQKPALKARGKLKGAPKQETRRIEDLMRSEFVVR